jgi:hypothetical protein
VLVAALIALALGVLAVALVASVERRGRVVEFAALRTQGITLGKRWHDWLKR